MSNETIGIMEGAYFVSRGELLKWLNDFLSLDPPYTKLEQVCSGSAFCQITDALYPGKVPLHRVNFNAKHEVEFIKNFKVLQETFDRLGVAKAIDIARLVKGKYQDNLEFCQWMKRFFDIHYANVEYQAVERRNAAIAAFSSTRSAPGSAARRQTIAPAATAVATKTKRETITVLPAAKAATATKSLIESKENKAPVVAATKIAPASTYKSASSSENAAAAAASKQQLEDAQKKIQSLKLMIDTLEKERNFYYSRLREVELLCQTYDDQSLPFLQQVLGILYKNDDSPAATPADANASIAVVDQQPQPLAVQ